MSYELYILNLCSDNSGGSFQNQSGVIPGSFRGQSGVIPGSFQGQSGINLGSTQGHSGVMQGSFRGHPSIHPSIKNDQKILRRGPVRSVRFRSFRFPGPPRTVDYLALPRAPHKDGAQHFPATFEAPGPSNS